MYRHRSSKLSSKTNTGSFRVSKYASALSLFSAASSAVNIMERSETSVENVLESLGHEQAVSQLTSNTSLKKVVPPTSISMCDSKIQQKWNDVAGPLVSKICAVLDTAKSDDADLKLSASRDLFALLKTEVFPLAKDFIKTSGSKNVKLDNNLVELEKVLDKVIKDDKMDVPTQIKCHEQIAEICKSIKAELPMASKLFKDANELVEKLTPVVGKEKAHNLLSSIQNTHKLVKEKCIFKCLNPQS